VRVAVLLGRAHFSPGVIDGRDGSNLTRAIAAYRSARALPAGGVDATLLSSLTAQDSAPVTADYVIADHDVKGPFLGSVPQDLRALAKLDAVGFATPREALAEKFHMSETLLAALNPGADFGKAGTRLVVVQAEAAPLAPVARLQVDKSTEQVRALDAAGQVIAAFPATVGSAERPAPSGEWAVKSVTEKPNYIYDPARLTWGPRKAGKLTIPPGPNNPVGDVWIALTAETYGIHGAPDPTQVGKTASHGCVRLTNWDAVALGRALTKGAPVDFVGDVAARA
jgi:lipoprotein-anchoring transpeptidase ErfK/SrfK